MECIARIVVGKCIKNEKFPNRILIFFFTQILPIMVRTKHKNGSPIKGSLLCVHNFFFSSNSVCGFAIRLICSICPKSWFDGVVVTTLKNSLIAIVCAFAIAKQGTHRCRSCTCDHFHICHTFVARISLTNI